MLLVTPGEGYRGRRQSFPPFIKRQLIRPISAAVSVQQVAITIGTGATSNTATINSVNTSRAVVFWGGFTTNNTGSASREVWPRIELTNSTTVTATRNTSSGSFTVTVYATVVEFDAGIISSIQSGTLALSSAQTTNTATISAVTTSQSVVLYLGGITASAAMMPSNMLFTLDLTNSTTVTATRNATGSSAMTIGYMVVEFQPFMTLCDSMDERMSAVLRPASCPREGDVGFLVNRRLPI